MALTVDVTAMPAAGMKVLGTESAVVRGTLTIGTPSITFCTRWPGCEVDLRD